MNTQPRVSLCMIVRNEAAQLRDCLEPVRGLVDELVVVDTGSTDGTRELAAELGARVIEFPWCDDFSAARNCSLDHARGEYILWLDADDRIDDVQRSKLAALIASLDGSPRAFVMTTRCTFWQEGMSERLVSHARLFRADRRARYVYRVHEQILPNLQSHGCQLEMTDIEVKHVGYNDQETHYRKALRDLRLVKMDYAAYPEDPLVLFHLGITYLRLHERENGLTYLLRSLKYATHAQDWVRKLYVSLESTMAQLGRTSEALSMVQQGLQNFPYDCQLLADFGYMSMATGDYLSAEQAFRRILARRDTAHLMHSVPREGFELEARRNLATLYRMQSRFDEAETLLQQLLADEPEYTWGWLSLGYLYLQRSHNEQVRRIVRRLEICPLGEAYAKCLSAELAKAEGRYTAAAALIDQVITLAPRLPLVRIIRLELLLTTQAGVEEIQLAAHEVLKLDANNDLARQVLSQLQHTTSQQSFYQAVATTISVDPSIRVLS